MIVLWTVRLSHVSPLSTPSVETEILHYPRERNLEQYTVAMQVSRTNGRTNSRRECGYRFSIKFSTVTWSITGNMRGVSSLEKPPAFERRLGRSCVHGRQVRMRKEIDQRQSDIIRGGICALILTLSRMLRKGEIFLLILKISLSCHEI